ncbi:putative permease protein of sugar ABC transporter [Nostoc commune NIES-4072]|uniref:Putative permease protein of sugar ABC transporter n=1 Tax=Nostoc commune NIES-4072 TaxID=2005467 RepID=A0A2R5FPD3_NOSCO|nr:putative permease protein of sugar ABC transporter [Nostoc commune HK-02]GBG20626.1 putative permease protein of sugar ABC transporter [Nostoc commune NIES-4072]
MWKVLSPFFHLRTSISLGYGYTAFIGRLNPLRIVVSKLLVILLYEGGQLVQIKLRFSLALAGMFQGILFFVLF